MKLSQTEAKLYYSDNYLKLIVMNTKLCKQTLKCLENF